MNGREAETVGDSRQDLQIKVYLVNDNLYEFSMSPREFTRRIVGDDTGAPVLGWNLSFATDDGREFEKSFDPRGDRLSIDIVPAGFVDDSQSDPSLPTQRQRWYEDLALGQLEDLRKIVLRLHPSQRDRPREALLRVADA